MNRYKTVLLLGVLTSSSLHGAVDLVTLPKREATQLTIYNSEDLTMVREHRLLTVKEGINRIQFTWANTLIDPTSIDFRILDHQEEVDLLDTTYPSGRNDALQWNIMSRKSGKLPVEIRYFTSGITWAADYVGLANEDETQLGLTGYVRVYNNSGEWYDNAQTRLVVGTINLVENIADLAVRPAPGQVIPFGQPTRQNIRSYFSHLEAVMDEGSAAIPKTSGKAQKSPKSIKKKGLSEYFLFTIAGREDIKHQEPKRLVSMKIEDVPLEALYKLSDREGGQRFKKFYRFKNKKMLNADGMEKKLSDMENLGVSPLPNGDVKLFSEYPNKDLAYVGGTQVKYIPVGDRVEVDVGWDQDITINRRLKDVRVSNVVARQYKRRLDNTYVLYYDLIDFDETFYYEEEVVSGKPVPVKTEIERRFDDEVLLWGHGPKPDDWDANRAGAYVDLHEHEGKIDKVDARHVQYFLDLKPGQKQFVPYSVTYKKRKAGPELNLKKVREPIR